ncbi:hypothetical protein [Schaalia odontolytica]|uniref:Uncharacterized protein n=1 Tax=Schaalia odontolytica F0309 TaxID=649742 RepID=D4TX31_9ACTO|nr:hypothetical protein [Schaalia odontolytica]EFF80482.1 hypothetical protein HMPREF0970_00487 [Schaalia odontolytica F0309]
MKTAIRALVSFACAALLSAGMVLPTQAAGRSTIAPTGEAAVEQMESTEGTQVVGEIIGILALGYAIAYNDGVSRAKSGEVTWSMWNGSFGHVLQAAASVSPAVWLGYLGWSQGFKGECRQHSYCYNR